MTALQTSLSSSLSLGCNDSRSPSEHLEESLRRRVSLLLRLMGGVLGVGYSDTPDVRNERRVRGKENQR